jgi:hypothetical protein
MKVRYDGLALEPWAWPNSGVCVVDGCHGGQSTPTKCVVLRATMCPRGKRCTKLA